ncbi:MAG: hypothetical protein JST89_04390 [Cyanobacteria bacterium SZAS-4]|nr:hypothetical protein [Cyanobacteria bacterium SZAS-4]
MAAFAAPAFCEDGHKLKQMTAACGLQNVLVAPSFFKIELPRKSIVISSKAPDWKIVTANTRSKLFCETPLSQFKANYIASATQMQLTDLALMQEIPAQKRASKFGAYQCIDFAVRQVDDSFNSFEGARSTTYRVLDDAKMPAAAGKVLKRLCGFTSIMSNKIPLSMEVISQQGMRSRFLITTEVIPAHDVKADVLSSKYKLVAKEIDVFRDPQMQEDIRDMLDANEHK